MQYIILRNEDGDYIATADSALEAVKAYVAFNTCADLKPFNILADSGQMALAELIAYANQYLLCEYNSIRSIYILGEKVF